MTEPSPTAPTLSSRHFINLSEERLDVALCLIATSPYTHAAAYAFDLH